MTAKALVESVPQQRTIEATAQSSDDGASMVSAVSRRVLGVWQPLLGLRTSCTLLMRWHFTSQSGKKGRRMPSRLPKIGLGILSVIALQSVEADAADGTLELVVARDGAAAVCPDRADVLATLTQLFPSAAQHVSAGAAADLLARVDIALGSEGFVATMQVSGRREGMRRIVDRDDHCEGLASALAVALALLVDPDAKQVDPAPPPSRAPASSPARKVVLGPKGPRWSMLPFSASATASRGSSQETAWGVEAGWGLVHRSDFAVRARGAHFFPTEEHQAGGSVSVALQALVIGGCWSLHARRNLHLLPCLDIGVGSQRGQARNYADNWSKRRPWAVLGPSVTSFAKLAGPLELTAGLGVSAALQRQSFSVAEVGPVQKGSRGGVYATVGLAARFDRTRQESEGAE